MASLPLQGFAGASMLFCVAATGYTQAQQTPAVASSHHGLEGHSHEIQPVAAHAHAPDASPDFAHECVLCASCCHSVAITEIASTVKLAASPVVEEPDSPLAMASRVSPVPDKPPRA
ncbi:MAG: hypothetical protein NDJ19_00150 [Ramlibacter sp.]|nr:hypothetical protein [Ramlibacter sp.]